MTDASPRALSTASGGTPSPRAWRLLVLIWVRPAIALRAVAGGSGWLWTVPAGLATVLLYLRFALMTAIEHSAAALPVLTGGLIGILVGWLLRALILWQAAALLGRRSSFPAIYRLSAWAVFPLLLRDVVQAGFMLATGAVPAAGGLAGLLAEAGGPAASSALGVILGRIDLFTAWYLALLVVAVRAGTGLSRGRAAVAVGCYVLLALLPALLTSLAGSAFG